MPIETLEKSLVLLREGLQLTSIGTLFFFSERN
jgi:hypothetical protein